MHGDEEDEDEQRAARKRVRGPSGRNGLRSRVALERTVPCRAFRHCCSRSRSLPRSAGGSANTPGGTCRASHSWQPRSGAPSSSLARRTKKRCWAHSRCNLSRVLRMVLFYCFFCSNSEIARFCSPPNGCGLSRSPHSRDFRVEEDASVQGYRV